MANLTETVTYPAGVYQLETNDPVLGGAGGISNSQAQALANRTAYLKAITDTLVGIVLPYAGSAAPSGWLLCYGQSLSTTTYAALFAIIGYTYGGSGASFNLPDLRGRVAAGKDNMGGTAASRLTASGGGVNGTVLGGAAGTETHTLTADQIPAHSHTFKYATATFTSGAGVMPQTFGAGTTANTDNNTGGGGAHPNVQPTIILNYIIKT